MDHYLSKKISDNNQRYELLNSTANSEGMLNNCTEPNVSHSTINTNFSEKAFDAILNNIKMENCSLFNDELSDLEDPVGTTSKSIDNKDEMCDTASKSYERNVNLSESNSQELADTELVDGKIANMCSPSTALPIKPKKKKKVIIQHTCLKCCSRCGTAFLLLDKPFHIFGIRSIEKRNEFFKIDPSLSKNSCLCDFCWKFLNKTYNSNKAGKKKVETFKEKRFRLLERVVKKPSKNKSQARRCSIHNCHKSYMHKMSVKQSEDLKKLISTFDYFKYVFVEFKKQTPDFLNFPISLCDVHFCEIDIISTCQICSDNLNDQFNADDWSMYETWKWVLIENALPLILLPGMFLCVTCKGYISEKKFRTIDLPRFQENIMLNEAVRLQIYGEPQDNLFNIGQGLTYDEFPIVVPKIKEEEKKKCVGSTKVKFSIPLITTTFHYEYDNDETRKEFRTSFAALNVVEQNLCTPKLEPKIEVLNSVEFEEENVETFTANESKFQLSSFYTDPIPNTSGIEMTSSSSTSVNDKPENILSKQNSSTNLTGHYVPNNCFNHTDVATNDVVNTSVDDNKDLLELHMEHQLGNYENKISNNEEINQYPKISNGCLVENVKIDENRSEIIDSQQVVSGNNGIKNYQNNLKIVEVFSQSISNTQDKSSMDLEKAVEPPKVMVNPVSLKRKQRKFVYNTVSNRGVKKQRLNEKYNSYKNNSTVNNSANSYGNKNIANSGLNSLSILNMNSNCRNEYVLNSDCVDVQDLSRNVDEKSLKLNSNSMKDIELNTNVPLINMDETYSSDSSCEGPIQFKQTSKKVPNSYNMKKMPKHRVNNLQLKKNIHMNSSDSESLSDSIILSDSDSLPNPKIVVSDSETLSDSENEEILPDSEIKETDYIVVGADDINLDSDNEIVESEFEIKTDYKFKSGSEKSSDGRIISNGENILKYTTQLDSVKDIKDINCEIVSDSVKKSESIIVSSNDKTESDSNKRSQYIYFSDSKEEFDNRKLSEILKESDSDSDSDELVSDIENERIECITVLDNKKEPSDENEKIECITVIDNEKEPSDENERIECITVFDNEKEPSDENERIESIIVTDDDNESQCIIISDSEDEFNNENVSDTIMMSNRKTIVDNSLALKTKNDNNTINNSKYFDFPCLEMNTDDDVEDNALYDEMQEYFKDIFAAIRYFVNSPEGQPLKNLYSRIGNDPDMLLYLMENLRMFYNGELVLSATANEFSKNYYKEQKEILYNHFGDPKDSLNASIPFILSTSYLHQYSKRSHNIEPVIIKDITNDTNLSTQNTSPTNTVAVNKHVSKVKRNRFFHVAPIKSFPSYNVFKLRDDIVLPTKSGSKIQNKVSTHTNPLLNCEISRLPDKNRTLTPVPHKNNQIILPHGVQLIRISKP